MGSEVKLALLVIGNGRDYIHDTIPAVLHHVNHAITARLMVDDSPDRAWFDQLRAKYPDFDIVFTGSLGMAGAVQAGFDLVLSYDPDYVLWIEDDMLITRQLPISQAITVLESRPNLAQMSFRRDPWDPSEFPCQLNAICKQATFFEANINKPYTTHDFLFSMNPCIIPKRILEYGWPSGPIGVGNEAGMTRKLLDAGYIFGSWGHPNDGQSWARHIGDIRAPSYQL